MRSFFLNTEPTATQLVPVSQSVPARLRWVVRLVVLVVLMVVDRRFLGPVELLALRTTEHLHHLRYNPSVMQRARLPATCSRIPLCPTARRHRHFQTSATTWPCCNMEQQRPILSEAKTRRTPAPVQLFMRPSQLLSESVLPSASPALSHPLGLLLLL
jgi:hypothetical protein